jgi:hypothetical protein
MKKMFGVSIFFSPQNTKKYLWLQLRLQFVPIIMYYDVIIMFTIIYLFIFSNFCRGRPAPLFATVRICVPVRLPSAKFYLDLLFYYKVLIFSFTDAGATYSGAR